MGIRISGNQNRPQAAHGRVRVGGVRANAPKPPHRPQPAKAKAPEGKVLHNHGGIVVTITGKPAIDVEGRDTNRGELEAAPGVLDVAGEAVDSPDPELAEAAEDGS